MASRPDQARPPSKGAKLASLIALVGAGTATLLIGDIRGDEGRVLHSYRDLGGIVTACDGHTGPELKMGQVFSNAQCDDKTAGDLLSHAVIVIRCTPALREVGREQQLRAATRFDYNTGAFCNGWWKKRPAPAKLMRDGQWRAGCDELLRYDLVKGRPIRGLTLRRQRERGVCIKGLV